MSVLEQLSPGERSRTWRARFVAREWLSRSLVVVPSLYIALALALAETIPLIEDERDLLSLELDPDSARTFLAAVAAGMIAFTGLRPRRVIARMVALAERAIVDTYPFALRGAPALESPPPSERATIVPHDGASGVLSAPDRARIIRAATAAGAIVEIGVAVGAYVPNGAPLFRVWGDAGRLDTAALQRATIFADERTIAQDPAFALRAIVDIALRALSPAVNDPTTAVQALDGLDVLLLDLARRDLDRRRITDEAGRLRLVYANPGWPELVDLALAEIRHYGTGSPQIPRRMRALLVGLSEQAPAIRRPALAGQLERLDRAVLPVYPDPVERANALVADHLGIGDADPRISSGHDERRGRA